MKRYVVLWCVAWVIYVWSGLWQYWPVVIAEEWTPHIAGIHSLGLINTVYLTLLLLPIVIMLLPLHITQQTKGGDN